VVTITAVIHVLGVTVVSVVCLIANRNFRMRNSSGSNCSTCIVITVCIAAVKAVVPPRNRMATEAMCYYSYYVSVRTRSTVLLRAVAHDKRLGCNHRKLYTARMCNAVSQTPSVRYTVDCTVYTFFWPYTWLRLEGIV